MIDWAAVRWSLLQPRAEQASCCPRTRVLQKNKTGERHFGSRLIWLVDTNDRNEFSIIREVDMFSFETEIDCAYD